MSEMSVSNSSGTAAQVATAATISASTSESSHSSPVVSNIRPSSAAKAVSSASSSKKSKAKSSPPSDSAGATGAAAGQTASEGASLDNSSFLNFLTSRIEELEGGMSGPSGNAEREVAKTRKKLLREVVKQCSDRSHSAEERLEWLQAKFAAQVSELMRLDKSAMEARRDLDTATREKDRVQEDLRRTHALKDRLEDLCRELQRDKKEALEKSRVRQEEEQSQRRELESRFSAAIKDVTARMDEQQAERERQLEENTALRGKLEEVVKQFGTFQKLLSKKDLEVQLHQTRCEHLEALTTQLQAQAAAFDKANELLKREAATGHVAMEENVELRNQLQDYLSKFEDIQDTLGKSNKMFDRLRSEVNEHQKLRQALSAERDEWRRRAELLEAAALIKQKEEKKEARNAKAQVDAINDLISEAAGAPSGAAAAEDVVSKVRRIKAQKDKLEGLCRLLQQQLKVGSTPSEPSTPSPEETEA